jgi:hypothetical protein
MAHNGSSGAEIISSVHCVCLGPKRLGLLLTELLYCSPVTVFIVVLVVADVSPMSTEAGLLLALCGASPKHDELPVPVTWYVRSLHPPGGSLNTSPEIGTANQEPAGEFQEEDRIIYFNPVAPWN